MEPDFETTIEHIVASIRIAGYDPYAQLFGYIKTGNEAYITRTGNARSMIKLLDCDQLQRYVDELKMKKIIKK